MKKFTYRYLFVAAWMLVIAPSAHAFDVCEVYKEYCPGYTLTTIAGGAYPSISDTFNINPAALPTTPSPLGIEGIMTTGGKNNKPAVNLATIKGIPRVGFGVANHSDNTFYTYNLSQAREKTTTESIIRGTPVENSIMSSLLFGAALAPLANMKLPLISQSSIGASMRYNELTSNFDKQFGISLNMPYATMGFSQYNSEGSGLPSAANYVPDSKTSSLTFGLKLEVINLEYTRISTKTTDYQLQLLKFYNEPVNIFTATLHLGAAHVTLARRTSYNVEDTEIKKTLITAQLQLLKNVGVAFQHNYIPGSDSLSAQIMF